MEFRRFFCLQRHIMTGGQALFFEKWDMGCTSLGMGWDGMYYELRIRYHIRRLKVGR